GALPLDPATLKSGQTLNFGLVFRWDWLSAYVGADRIRPWWLWVWFILDFFAWGGLVFIEKTGGRTHCH
ncbi:MAG: hypothetical protein FWG65_03485, partial [Turicibacter sp.]|nr:hypothetical protein [Turicibacter sp.]